jgi:hypothetical protein
MMNKLFLTGALLGNIWLFGQTGSMNISFKDKITQEELSFSEVVIILDEKIITKRIANVFGECVIDSLAPGKYNLKATYSDYAPATVNGIIVIKGKAASVNMRIQRAIQLKDVEINSYHEPLVEPTIISISCGWMGDHFPFLSSKQDSIKKQLPISNFKTLKCYPNPTNGPLIIENSISVKEILLIDVAGKLVQKYTPDKQRSEMDLSSFPPGTYFLKCYIGGDWLTEKVLLVN